MKEERNEGGKEGRKERRKEARMEGRKGGIGKESREAVPLLRRWVCLRCRFLKFKTNMDMLNMYWW